MTRHTTVLAFDTSAAHCAAALLRDGRVLAARAEEMGRGQAERLMPLLEELLADAGLSWADIGRIGVGIGPGNFTGIRISVSAARGLALALDVPAIGVDTFDVIHLEEPDGIAAVPAPRGQAYMKARGTEPALAPAPESGLCLPPPPEEIARRIARIAAGRDAGTRPAPLYIRPADAAPARDAPPALLP